MLKPPNSLFAPSARTCAEEEEVVVAFGNQVAFHDPSSRMMAAGVDLRKSNAIVDLQGNVLAYAQTGGMMAPTPFEIVPGEKLYRFGSVGAGMHRVAVGSWWLERGAFEKLVSFAQAHDLSIGMALRYLCLVPPEWSDVTILIRARANARLLAWRGLADTVVTKTNNGGPPVKMTQQNEIAARRVYQLFIPGLVTGFLSIEQDFHLDQTASRRGFLYF
ncbi:hypothetical protein J2R76_000129 [Bradyrhizobium sp. USDA 4532]|uniref:hypothetical protein n=1 Tax=unclassified Bradyrhizobium TaxID=2631580 RepID=UPI00209E78FA|nr:MULTISPECIES: hypothetical protein [unclassified Bradyrhizobium]MCP1831701.1 hypothetical protein [Bradyrhizobium sp. USDA 4545]MCP1916538.1 hypothetical protein [Bradyrhizobium sp. USDA 4532]